MSRQSIIDYALQFLGSHYLHGSCGDTPEYDDGVWYNTTSVVIGPPSTDVNDPKIFAAQLHKDQVARYGLYVCAGRFEKIWGGRYAISTDPDLQEYLNSLEAKPQCLWEPFHLKFSPRTIRGANIGPTWDDPVGNNGRTVWGEDCRHKRHFDCVSFVNYVLSYTTTRKWGFAIVDYAKASADFFTEITKTDPAVAGDILLRGSTHIGFLAANDHVVQAQQHDAGVHADEGYNSGKTWSKRLRVLDQFIK
jgi:hypothetical protein